MDENKKICPSCKNETDATNNYCDKCGTKLEVFDNNIDLALKYKKEKENKTLSNVFAVISILLYALAFAAAFLPNLKRLSFHARGIYAIATILIIAAYFLNKKNIFIKIIVFIGVAVLIYFAIKAILFLIACHEALSNCASGLSN